MSCSLFFIEPNPFSGQKLDYLIILCCSVWIIYTFDHILDGKKQEGRSGILRYDQNFKFRKLLTSLCVLVSAYAIWLVYKNKATLYVNNGLMLLPILSIYFYLKFNGKLKPILKMVCVSAIVSTVVVNLYYSDFYALLKLEWIIMALLVFLNQLVLNYFETDISSLHEDNPSKENYLYLAKRIFIWILLVLMAATYLNTDSWPFTISLLCIAILLRVILWNKKWFICGDRYRFWADFSFVLLWPLLKMFQSILSIIS